MTQRRTLPPKALPLAKLTLAEEIKSHNKFLKNSAVFHAHKDSKKSGKTKHYFFKQPTGEKNELLLALEAYGNAICRFLATEEYTPSSHVCYDDKFGIIGVVTKALPDFKSNAMQPLKTSDLEIDSLSLKIEHQQNSVLSKIKKLLIFLEKNPEEKNYAPEASLLQRNFYGLKKTYYDLNIKEYSIQYLQKPDRWSDKSLNELLNKFDDYKNKLKDSPLKEKYYNLLVNRLISIINNIYKLQFMCQSSINSEEMNIKYFEELHQNLKNKKIEISDIKTQHNLKNYQTIRGLATSLVTRYIYKEGDNNNTNLSSNGLMIDFGMTKQNIQYQYAQYNEIDKLLRRPNSKTYQCTAHDIDFFPNIKDAQICYWPTKKSPIINKFITDAHAFIDAFFNYTSRDQKIDETEEIVNFVTQNLVKYFQPKPQAKNLVNTISEYIHSTIIKIKAYKLNIPEEAFVLRQQKIQLAYSIKFAFDLYIKENYKTLIACEKELRSLINIENIPFTIEDNNNFKKLTTHPVFIFHKYKTFLKYILTTKKMYTSLATMYIASDHQELINQLIIDEEHRLTEIRNTLMTMPEFKQFIECDGRFAFALIKDEFLELKDVYTKKSSASKHYDAFDKSLDLHQLETNYQELAVALNIEHVNKKRKRSLQ